MGWNKPCFLDYKIGVWKLIDSKRSTRQNGYLQKMHPPAPTLEFIATILALRVMYIGQGGH